MLLGNTAIRAIQKCYIQTLRVTRARILQAAVTILSAGWSVFRHLSCRPCRHTGCYRLSMRYPRTWAEATARSWSMALCRIVLWRRPIIRETGDRPSNPRFCLTFELSFLRMLSFYGTKTEGRSRGRALSHHRPWK